MQIGQAIRHALRGIGDAIAGFWRWVSGVFAAKTPRLQDEAPASPQRQRPRRIMRILRATLVLIIIVVPLYYGIGAWLTHTIDDDMAFTPAPGATPAGGSAAIAMASALVEREVAHHGWVANDPFFLPGAILSNMPAWQMGIVAGMARVTADLERLAGIAEPGEDAASRLLATPGDVWLWQPADSLIPRATAGTRYLRAARALTRLNRRIAEGEATYDVAAGDLARILSRMVEDLDASAEEIARAVTGSGDGARRPAFLFFHTKGRVYAYARLLNALATDGDRALSGRGASGAYHEAIAALEQVAAFHPPSVRTGDIDSRFTPNHLAVQGFLLERARRKLETAARALRE
jgi:hypothetical protein